MQRGSASIATGYRFGPFGFSRNLAGAAGTQDMALRNNSFAFFLGLQVSRLSMQLLAA